MIFQLWSKAVASQAVCLGGFPLVRSYSPLRLWVKARYPAPPHTSNKHNLRFSSGISYSQYRFRCKELSYDSEFFVLSTTLYRHVGASWSNVSIQGCAEKFETIGWMFVCAQDEKLRLVICGIARQEEVSRSSAEEKRASKQERGRRV